MGAALAQARLRAEALQAQNEEMRARLADAERAVRAVGELEDALRDGLARATELESMLAGRTRQVAEVSEEMGRVLAASESELTRAAEVHAQEIGRYEEALRDRAEATHLLEAELVRRERIIHELVDALEESAQTGVEVGAASDPVAAGVAHGRSVEEEDRFAAHPEPAQDQEQLPERDVLIEENARLRHKLDALALDLARREGEGHAIAWTLVELERRLAIATAGSSPDDREVEPGGGTRAFESGPKADVERQLAAVLDEIDVLRRALAQEHEARIRAESGERPVVTQAASQRQDESPSEGAPRTKRERREPADSSLDDEVTSKPR
jgi:hypothetical protein